ncbi:hypothetical protein EMIT0P218_10018 [Pseudomonas sp. IT-P218]
MQLMEDSQVCRVEIHGWCKSAFIGVVFEFYAKQLPYGRLLCTKILQSIVHYLSTEKGPTTPGKTRRPSKEQDTR